MTHLNGFDESKDSTAIVLADDELANVCKNFTLIGRPHPFRRALIEAVAPEGASIESLLKGLDHTKIEVRLNGDVVPFELWGLTKPKAGTFVEVIAFPQGGEQGEGGKNTGQTLISIGMLVATVIAPYVAGPYWGAVIALGVSLAGNILLRQLIKAPKKDNKQTAIGVNTWSGQSNEERRYGVSPIILGQVNFFPPLAASPFTEQFGYKQHMFMLLDLGLGSVVVDEVRVGDTALQDVANARMDVAQQPSLYANDVYQDAVNRPLATVELWTTDDYVQGRCTQAMVGMPKEPNAWSNLTQTAFSQSSSDEITVDFMFPPAARNPFVIQFRKEGDTDWTSLADIFGTQMNFNPPDPYMSHPETPYTGLYTGMQMKVENFTFGGKVYSAYLSTVESVSLFKSYGNLLTGHYAYDINNYPSWVFEVVTTKMDVHPVSFKLKLPERARYEVRVIAWTNSLIAIDIWGRYGAPADPSGKQGQACNRASEFRWTSLKSTTYLVPSNLPTTKLALQFTSSADLNGNIQQINVLAAQLIPAWNGSTWVAQQRTSNPAWIYRWLLTGCPGNPRLVTTAEVDDSEIIAWGADCAAKGFIYNGVIDSPRTFGDVLADVAAAGRATFSMRDGKYSIVRDHSQATPVQHFTPRNSWDFKGNRVFNDSPHALRCNFVNPQADWQDDTMDVYDDGYNVNNASVFETMDFPGVTDPAAVWRLARYHMAVGRLRQNEYSWMADVEHLVCNRGDLVKVAHDITHWGAGWGRIKATRKNRVAYSNNGLGWLAGGTTPPTIVNGTTHLGNLAGSITFTSAMTSFGYGGCRATRNDTGYSWSFLAGETDTASAYLSLSRVLTGSENIVFYATGAEGLSIITITPANSAQYVGSWVRVSGTLTHPGSGGDYFTAYLGAAVGSDVTLYVSKVQVDVGSAMTEFMETGAPGSIASYSGFGSITLDEKIDISKLVTPTVRIRLNDGSSVTSAIKCKNLVERSSVSFSRAGNATYRGSDGYMKTAGPNGIRYEYGYRGEYLGALIEKGCTNLIAASQDMSLWSNMNHQVTTNSYKAPDGTLTANKVAETTANSTHYSYTWATLTVGQPYTYSVFVKAGTVSSLMITCLGTSQVTATFDLVNGVVSNTLNSVATIDPWVDGWYRVSMYFTAVASSEIFAIRKNELSYTGDPANYFYAWGAQAEPGKVVTSYVPSSQGTRNYDALYTNTDEISYNGQKGTLVIEFDTNVSTGGGQERLFQFSDGGSSNNLSLFIGTNGNWYALQKASGTTQFTKELVPSIRGTPFRIALRYGLDDFAISINGGVPLTNVGAVPININSLILGGGSGFYLNGHIKRMQYYSYSMTNAQLQSCATLGTDIPDAYAWDLSPSLSSVNVGDLAMVGSAGIESVNLIITKIEPQEDFTARITAVDEAPGVYTADSGVPPTFVSQIDGMRYHKTPRAPIIGVSDTNKLANDGGTTTAAITLLIQGASPAFY